MINVNIEQVEYFRGLNFSWTKIAAILGISRSTFHRRLQVENISDGELDQQVLSIKQLFPNDGERMIIGHLISGFKEQE